jgi:hypothetical protein
VPLIWLGARAVLRFALVIAQLHAFGIPGVANRSDDPWWVPVVGLASWAAVVAGAGLVGRRLIRARRGGRGPVADGWVVVRSVAAAMAVVAAVWATDGMSALVLGQRGWVDTLDAVVDRR